MSKRYYYLKLEEDFFRNKVIKALRKLPAGSDLVICYMKMQLHYMKNEGFITFDGIYDTIEEEIAEEIEENKNNVRMTLKALQKWNYIESVEEDKALYLNEMQKRVGSKSDVALRVAKHREKKNKMLQCNSDVTKSNAIQEIEIEREIEIDRENKKNISAEAFKKGSPIFIKIILNDKSYHSVTEEEVKKYQKLYQNVDVKQELRNMAGWCEANNTRRKTKRGIKAFITNWLIRHQDKNSQKIVSTVINKKEEPKKAIKNELTEKEKKEKEDFIKEGLKHLEMLQNEEL